MLPLAPLRGCVKDLVVAVSVLPACRLATITFVQVHFLSNLTFVSEIASRKAIQHAQNLSLVSWVAAGPKVTVMETVMMLSCVVACVSPTLDASDGGIVLVMFFVISVCCFSMLSLVVVTSFEEVSSGGDPEF
jgi:hypothetical protein